MSSVLLHKTTKLHDDECTWQTYKVLFVPNINSCKADSKYMHEGCMLVAVVYWVIYVLE